MKGPLQQTKSILSANFGKSAGPDAASPQIYYFRLGGCLWKSRNLRSSVGALPSSLRLVPARSQQYVYNMAWEPRPLGAAVTHVQWEPLEILRLLVSALPCLARSRWGWTAAAQQAGEIQPEKGW